MKNAFFPLCTDEKDGVTGIKEGGEMPIWTKDVYNPI